MYLILHLVLTSCESLKVPPSGSDADQIILHPNTNKIQQEEMEIWYAAYLRLCPSYSANHMSPFCGHICRKGHSQIGSVLTCVQERARKSERDFRSLYRCHISYSRLFLSPVHLYGCDRSHYDFGTASARLANAAFWEGISAGVRLFCMPRARTRTRAHPRRPITAVVRCCKHDRNNSINYQSTDRAVRVFTLKRCQSVLIVD